MPANSTTSLERLQRNDHDTLIRVEAKVDNLTADIKVMGDSQTQKLIDHESRLRKIEDLTIIADPITNLAKFNELLRWRDNVTSQRKYFYTLAGIVGAIVSLLVPYALNRLWGSH